MHLLESSSMPSDLAHGLYLALKEAKPNGLLSEDCLEEAQEIVKYTRGKGWDWNRHWAAHAYLSWTQNFHKAHQCALIWAKMNKDKLSKRLSILDLGCGSGASMAGICLALRDKCDSIVVHGVDSSRPMLTLCEKTFKEWADFTPNIKATLELADADMYIGQSLNNWDIVMASYLFCAAKKLNPNDFHHKSMIVIDLPDAGFSKISICGKNYRLAYDPYRSLDVGFLEKLGLGIKPDDWYPEIVPLKEG